MLANIQTRKFTRKEYHQLAEAGILHPDERVELIEGDIVVISPMGRKHISYMARLTTIFVLVFHKNATVISQTPVVMNGKSEPEPDFAILKPSDDYYASRKPRGTDALLLIEISDSTLRYDKSTKVKLYAANGVPEYWVIDTVNEVVEVFRGLENGSYQTEFTARRGEATRLMFQQSKKSTSL